MAAAAIPAINTRQQLNSRVIGGDLCIFIFLQWYQIIKPFFSLVFTAKRSSEKVFWKLKVFSFLDNSVSFLTVMLYPQTQTQYSLLAPESGHLWIRDKLFELSHSHTQSVVYEQHLFLYYIYIIYTNYLSNLTVKFSIWFNLLTLLCTLEAFEKVPSPIMSFWVQVFTFIFKSIFMHIYFT